MLKLEELTSIPDGLLTIERTTDLHTVFKQPTLLHLEGEIKQPLFISVLLHANEDTGFFAIQSLLKRYQDKPLPRSLSIFFGNIAAAKEGLRRLDGQPDYNRVWPGTDHPECDETRLMQKVVNSIAKRSPFASIDIHNNTGKNPHYGCINNVKETSLHLASLFSHIVVYFETPKGVQSMAMSQLCPAITIECGKPHLAQGVEHASDFIETVLHLDTLKPHVNNPPKVDIFHTVARVTVPDSISFAFAGNMNNKADNKKDTQQLKQEYDVLFSENIDQINFSKLPKDTVLATVKNGIEQPLKAWDDKEKDVSNDYFSLATNEQGRRQLKLTRSLMPAMLTLDKKIVRQDCLCYLMEEYKI